MKIALLGPSHPSRGGIVHFNSRLAGELQHRKDLTVDLFYWAKPYPRFLLPPSSQDSFDNESALTFHRGGLRVLSYTDPLTWLQLVRSLRSGRYDMFVTHWVHPVHFPVFAFIFMMLRLFTETRICLIVHNSLPHERFAGDAIMSRLVMNMAHRLIVHGPDEADLARRIGADSGKIIPSFHPIYDQFSFPSEPVESIRSELGLRKKVLLFFGFIRPYKGLDILLDAFRSVASEDPDISLLVVGESFYSRGDEGDEKQRFMMSLPEDDPLRDQVVWIDRYVPNEEVGKYFVVADVLVAPYREVTQSGPLNIAYAFDKPAIASDLAAFRECVVEGESGLLFRTGDSDDLAAAIRRFFHAPPDSEKIKRFRRRFGWDRYAELLLKAKGTGLEQ